MIEPVQSLAFSIQVNPKVYALLLGSGVSRSAEIPTSWEIVMDLLGKLAASLGEKSVSDLEEWYVQKYQEAPDYSKILDGLFRTPSERQQLLRSYIEPTDKQREEGMKQPTAAHKAIARLVAQGFIKIIVTTNFDRLIEKALEDEGVVPTVLSTAAQVKGARPLDHIECCVFKVHGDYIDSPIRNTQSELDEYPREYETLLDRIFDEYGLIVCGWSGRWDTALRKALFRAQSRRFTTYWALHGEKSDEARQLIHHRNAQIISVDSADHFFQKVQEAVTSIEESPRLHPLSTEAAVAILKRYLSRPEHRIQLSDLIDTTVEQVVRDTTGEEFEVGVGAPQPDKTTITARLRRYESACSTLVSMGAVGGYWSDENNSAAVWERAIERLSTMTFVPWAHYYEVWRDLRAYPGILMLYALGISAVEAEKLEFVNRIFRKTVTDASGGVAEPPNALSILLTCRNTQGYMRRGQSLLEGKENSPLPINDWLHDALRAPLRQFIPDDIKYSLVFDKFEILAALGFGSMQYHRFPLGAFIWRSQNRQHVITEIEQSIKTQGNASPFVQCGIFGNNAGQCLGTIERFKKYIGTSARDMGIFF